MNNLTAPKFSENLKWRVSWLSQFYVKLPFPQSLCVWPIYVKYFSTICRSHALVILYFFLWSVSHFRCIQFHSAIPCCGTFYCHIKSIIVRVFSIDKVLILQHENLPIKYHLCYHRIRIWQNYFQNAENSLTWSDLKAVFTVKTGLFLQN